MLDFLKPRRTDAQVGADLASMLKVFVPRNEQALRSALVAYGEQHAISDLRALDCECVYYCVALIDLISQVLIGPDRFRRIALDYYANLQVMIGVGKSETERQVMAAAHTAYSQALNAGLMSSPAERDMLIHFSLGYAFADRCNQQEGKALEALGRSISEQAFQFVPKYFNRIRLS